MPTAVPTRSLLLAFAPALLLCASLPACGSAESEKPAPVSKPAPAPAPAPAPKAPAPPPVAKPVDPMVAANALYEAGKYAEAVEAFKAITEAHPDNGEAWFKLGYCLHASGRLDEALVAHAKAAEFPQYRPVALYNLGCAHALKGNADAAFEALNKSIDSGFDNLKQLQEDTDLTSLRADPRWAPLVARLSSSKA